MTVTVADSRAYRLAAVPAGGPLSGRCVALPPGAGIPAACLMTIRSGDGVIRTAVRAEALPDVPARVVAVGDDLAAEWDVELDRVQWTLEQVTPVPIRTLTLELPTERDPVAAGKEIAAAGVVGELLWVPGDGTDIWLSVDGLPHRVRQIDTDERTEVVATISPHTTIEIYASAVRAGVDIVILADCSGSMKVDDLPADPEGRWLGRGRQWITRMDALKQSLRELLEMRLQISGRISRLAIVEFNHETRQLFPRDGGMAQLDAGSPPQQLEEFRHGVALLRASGTTDIGNALHEAANLLYRHGHAGNERLIVLVSDGANWVRKGEQGIGEVVHAVQEPVSLMTHLHADMNIRLHAIGISTEELFRRRGGWEPTEAVIPNHVLLEELVRVGGGDPTTIGGLDILEGYFSGLATGIVHRVRDRLADRRDPGQLPGYTAAALKQLLASNADVETRRSDLGHRVMERVGECKNEAVRTLGGPIWDMEDVSRLVERDMGRTVDGDGALARFLGMLTRTLQPNSLADGAGNAVRALHHVLDRLKALSSHEGSIVAQFGGRADTPAAVQAEVMREVHDALAVVVTELRRLPALNSGDTGEEPTGFVYRD